MAFNLFDSITGKSSIQGFLGNKPPETPSLMLTQQPTSPRTSSYTKPQKKQSSFIPQANAGESLVSDDEIEKMIKAGATDDEIVMIVGELEKERSQKQVEQVLEKSTWDSIKGGVDYLGEGIMNVTGGVVAETPKILGNIGSFAMEASQYNPGTYLGGQIKDIATAPFSDKTYGELRTERGQEYSQSAKKIEQAGKTGKEFVQKYGAYDPNSTGAKIGEVGADIVATIVGPGKVFKTAKEAGIAIKTLAGLANASIEGTTAAVSNYVATEGRLPTKEEVAQFIALQGGAKFIGATAGQVKKLPSARLIPTTITEAGKDIRKGIDIGEAISKTGISFTKGQLARKIEKKITGISQAIDTHLNNYIKANGPSNVTISDVTKGMKESLMKDATIAKQLQGTPIQRQAISDSIDETIQAYKDLYKNKKFDLNAQQQLKKDIYNGLQNVFNKNLQTSKLTAQQVTEKQIAKTLKEGIEAKVPEIGILNKELQPFMEASKRLNAKGGYSGYLTDILAGGFASGSPTGIMQDPVGYMKNFALGVLTKRLGTSTLAKTTTSTILKRTEDLFKNPQFQKLILDQYRVYNSNKQ